MTSTLKPDLGISKHLGINEVNLFIHQNDFHPCWMSLISLNYIPVMLEELRLSRPAKRRRLFQRLGASKAARRVNLMIRLLEHGLREAALQARAVSGN